MIDLTDSAAVAAALASVQPGPWVWRSDDGVYALTLTRSRVSPAGQLEVYITGEGWISYAEFTANRAELTDVLAGDAIPG